MDENEETADVEALDDLEVSDEESDAVAGGKMSVQAYDGQPQTSRLNT